MIRFWEITQSLFLRPLALLLFLLFLLSGSFCNLMTTILAISAKSQGSNCADHLIYSEKLRF